MQVKRLLKRKNQLTLYKMQILFRKFSRVLKEFLFISTS